MIQYDGVKTISSLSLFPNSHGWSQRFANPGLPPRPAVLLRSLPRLHGAGRVDRGRLLRLRIR